MTLATSRYTFCKRVSQKVQVPFGIVIVPRGTPFPMNCRAYQSICNDALFRGTETHLTLVALLLLSAWNL